MSLAPLPTLDDLKLVCRIELTDSSSDGLIAALAAAAESIVQQKTNLPVLDATFTDIDDTLRAQPTSTFAPPSSLLLPRRCIDTVTNPPVVTAFDGTVIASTTYRIDGLAGIIYGNVGVYFGQGPYTVTYHAGLVHHPEWAFKYRAIAAQVIRDLVAWLYDQPDPAIKHESAIGASQSFDTDGLPGRLCLLISALPGAGVALGI